MEEEKNFLMYFQTTLRNVGLFTSLGIALLIAKSKNKYVPLKLLSIGFLIVALSINYHLVHKYKESKDTDIIQKWMNVAKLSFTIICVLVTIATYKLLNYYKLL
jgi:cellobiose-specific phosphotransferase system component IIC